MPDAETTTTTSPENSTGITPSKKQVRYQEVQETVNRLAAHKGVTAVLILNKDGDILTQTGKGLVGNAKLLKQMMDAASLYVKSIPTSHDDDEGDNNDNNEENNGGGTEGQNAAAAADTDNDDEISFVRIRSRNEEILISPKNQYVLVVVQDPNIASL